MAIEPRKRLGRGLDALLASVPAEAEADAPTEARAGQTGSPAGAIGSSAARQSVSLALIHRNPRNPRTEFRADELEDLAASIRAHGIVQPIVVRRHSGTAGVGADGYEIIAGERRWRAAQLAGLHDIPITILEVSDKEALELAIVENVQRSDLNPIEEARGYEALMQEFAYTQADLGATIGKSRAHVANTLRLLRLPESILAMLESGELSAGHGRALLTAKDPEKLARLAVDKSLSVRETERLAQKPEAEPRAPASRTEKNADIRAFEKDLSAALGLLVDIRHRSDGGGELRISYRDLDQLEGVAKRLRS